jgi:hypothetical protein
MRIGASLTLIAIGAILKFAITKQFTGVSLSAVGIVLMIVVALGLLITLVLMSTRRRTDVQYGRDGVSYLEPPRGDPRY